MKKSNLFEDLRKLHGLNKTQMAHRLKIGKGYYSMLESSQREISKYVGMRLHGEFGVPLEEIFFDKGVHAVTTPIKNMGEGDRQE